MGKLTGKVALITGASRGIGKEIAIELAKEGANVVVNYSKDEEGATNTINEIKRSGGNGIKIKANVGKYEDCEELIEKTIKTYNKIDILVNNAGISKIGLFMDCNKEDIEDIFNVNLHSAMYLCKLAIPYMLSKGGNIINISSIWGETGASCEVLYSSTKGAMNLFTKSLGKEMAMSNIRVNAIAPGVIDTEMNSNFSEGEKKEIIEEIPMGRMGIPKEVAKLAVFLSSEESSYITGEVIKVDGGML